MYILISRTRHQCILGVLYILIKYLKKTVLFAIYPLFSLICAGYCKKNKKNTSHFSVLKTRLLRSKSVSIFSCVSLLRKCLSPGVRLQIFYLSAGFWDSKSIVYNICMLKIYFDQHKRNLLRATRPIEISVCQETLLN